MIRLLLLIFSFTPFISYSDGTIDSWDYDFRNDSAGQPYRYPLRWYGINFHGPFSSHLDIYNPAEWVKAPCTLAIIGRSDGAYGASGVKLASRPHWADRETVFIRGGTSFPAYERTFNTSCSEAYNQLGVTWGNITGNATPTVRYGSKRIDFQLVHWGQVVANLGEIYVGEDWYEPRPCVYELDGLVNFGMMPAAVADTVTRTVDLRASCPNDSTVYVKMYGVDTTSTPGLRFDGDCFENPQCSKRIAVKRNVTISIPLQFSVTRDSSPLAGGEYSASYVVVVSSY